MSIREQMAGLGEAPNVADGRATSGGADVVAIGTSDQHPDHGPKTTDFLAPPSPPLAPPRHGGWGQQKQNDSAWFASPGPTVPTFSLSLEEEEESSNRDRFSKRSEGGASKRFEAPNPEQCRIVGPGPTPTARGGATCENSDCAVGELGVGQFDTKSYIGTKSAAADRFSALTDRISTLEAQLANAAEDRAELLDDYLAAKRDAERDAARATVAEQDLREARRCLEGIAAKATSRVTLAAANRLARRRLAEIAALAAQGLERTR